MSACDYKLYDVLHAAFITPLLFMMKQAETKEALEPPALLHVYIAMKHVLQHDCQCDE